MSAAATSPTWATDRRITSSWPAKTSSSSSVTASRDSRARCATSSREMAAISAPFVAVLLGLAVGPPRARPAVSTMTRGDRSESIVQHPPGVPDSPSAASRVATCRSNSRGTGVPARAAWLPRHGSRRSTGHRAGGGGPSASRVDGRTGRYRDSQVPSSSAGIGRA
ncbi:hypothetical protein JD77_03745 [Micromonospora olivasterospora]|uniref:Uncharacterized protein n=1 Tax=Micromonospora olivasterospora TaxID=1880 RepID=A0A562ICN5_MICOL|nr:hypothetical protein JD77_03745 [Micromonospora olivasterospora]